MTSRQNGCPPLSDPACTQYVIIDINAVDSANSVNLSGMNPKMEPRKYLNLIGAIILAVGLVSAALIYLTAQIESRNVLGYENEGGSSYPIMPDDSKQYLRSLEIYGGTANVLADEFRRWFDGLWHGKTLAFTVAFISIVISFGFFYAARLQPSNRGPEAGGNDDWSKERPS